MELSELTNPLRNFYVSSTGTYTTIQSAIDAASSLVESAVADPFGVTIWIPSGYWDENIVINRNINLRGAGKDSTTLPRLDVRPFNDVIAPDFVRIFDLTVQNLIIDNQTTIDSGIYNTTNLLLNYFQAKNCGIETYNIQNAWFIYFDDCRIGNVGSTDYITLVSQNLNQIRYNFCYFSSDISHTMDSNAANALVSPDEGIYLDGTFYLNNCTTFGYIFMITVGGSASQAVLEAVGGFLGYINIDTNSTAGIQGTAFFDLTGTVSYLQGLTGYTPVLSTDWTTQPKQVDGALDQLASRTKALEGVLFDVIDTFSATGNGTTRDSHTAPVNNFALQVEETGGVTEWTVILEGSTDGTIFDTIATHTQTNGTGVVLWADGFPSSYFRTRCTVLTGGTNVTAHVIAMN